MRAWERERERESAQRAFVRAFPCKCERDARMLPVLQSLGAADLLEPAVNPWGRGKWWSARSESIHRWLSAKSASRPLMLTTTIGSEADSKSMCGRFLPAAGK